MLTFHRGSFSELWITIRAGEPLAILNTGYIEDYFGVDGQLTLRSMEDDTRLPFSMEEDVAITPSISHDVFTGFIDLSTLSDGIYRVEGRVRDTLGNYRILSEVENPFGDEDVTLFEIEITPLEIVVNVSASIDLIIVAGPEIDLVLRTKPSADVLFIPREISVDLFQLPKPSIDLSLSKAYDCDVYIAPTPQLDIINVWTKITT